MEIFIIDKIHTKEIFQQLKDFNDQCLEIGDSREKAVVIGGDTLGKVL